MTEYEIATLAFREATLASRTIGHWLAGGQILATLVIGFGQIGISGTASAP